MSNLEEHERRALQTILNRLVTNNDFGDVLDCINDKEFSLNLLHWRLLSLMKKQSDEQLSDEKIFQEVVVNEFLELLLCSGYVQDHRYCILDMCKSR